MDNPALSNSIKMRNIVYNQFERQVTQLEKEKLIYSRKSLKDINQKINFELKNIVHWLRANKFPLKPKERK